MLRGVVLCGQAVAIGGVLFAGLVVGCLRLRRVAGDGRGSLLLVGLVVALATSAAWTSHAAARLGPRGLLLALDALHQLAAAAWIGGLGLLIVLALGRGQGAWP